MQNLRKSIPTLIFIGFSIMMAAQKAPEKKVKFGKISQEEIDMQTPPIDQDASAVILFDIGFCSVGTKYNQFDRHRRIKIFKNEGKDYANIRIPYRPKSEQTVTNLKVACYNWENGQLIETKISDDNIYEENLNKTTKVKKIVIPNVKEGSIIEYKYGITGAIDDWEFQHDIPNLWSEFKLEIPEFFTVSQIGTGSTPYIYTNKSTTSELFEGSNSTYIVYQSHWIQKDIPALKEEEYMNSKEDYRSKLIFYLESIQLPMQTIQNYVPSWDNFSKVILEDEDIGMVVRDKELFRDELAQIIKPEMTNIEKAQEIYNYIGSNFELRDFESYYITESATKLKKSKKLTPGEKNLFFLNMMHNAGFEVSPVMMRARKDGKLGTAKPVYERFNKLISSVVIDNDTLSVDVSGYPRPMKLLPSSALTEFGVRLFDKNKYQFYNPTSKLATKRFVQSSLILNPDNGISGGVTITNNGHSAYNSRSELLANGQDNYIKKIAGALMSDGVVDNLKIEEVKQTSETPMKTSFNIKTNSYFTITDDKIYLEPMLCFGNLSNPFKADERSYAVDFNSPSEDIIMMNYTIPPGYTLAEQPKPIKMSNEDGTLKFDYLPTLKGQTLSIISKIIIKKSSFPPDEYRQVKEMYGQILTKHQEQFVLVKTQ